MLKKASLILMVAIISSLCAFNSRANAASTLFICLEASCSSMSFTLGGQTHTKKLSCDSRLIGFTGIPAGIYSWSATGCGLTTSGTAYMNGYSIYLLTLCPPSGWPCCSKGCGEDSAYKCTECSGAPTTTTTTPTTTSTTTSTTYTTSTTSTTTSPSTTTTTIPPIVTEYPVYRFFSTQTNTHFYTISATERDTIIANYPWYRYEGTAWFAYLPGYQKSNTNPVYRFYSTHTNTHFFTISESEKDTVIEKYPWYRYEGVAWYAYLPGYAPTATFPVYRFYSTETGTHFFTISEEEKNTIIANYPWYRYEGIAWYAYPPW